LIILLLVFAITDSRVARFGGNANEGQPSWWNYNTVNAHSRETFTPHIGVSVILGVTAVSGFNERETSDVSKDRWNRKI
jgi:hypothetical protein